MYKNRVNSKMVIKVQVDDNNMKDDMAEKTATGISVNYYNAKILETDAMVIPVTGGINPADFRDLRFKMLLEMAFPNNDIAGMRYDDDETYPESVEANVLCDLYGYAIVPKGFVKERIEPNEYSILFLEKSNYFYDEELHSKILEIGD